MVQLRLGRLRVAKVVDIVNNETNLPVCLDIRSSVARDDKLPMAIILWFFCIQLGICTSQNAIFTTAAPLPFSIRLPLISQ